MSNKVGEKAGKVESTIEKEESDALDTASKATREIDNLLVPWLGI